MDNPAPKRKSASSPARPPKARAGRIVLRLAELYPEAFCGLVHSSPFQLLVATILSAQCTDARVNLVTPALFARFPDPASFADADPAEVERLVQSTGFYRNKARNIQLCCRQLIERHGGQVPGDLDSLVRLAGVGRKTANVVLGDSFGVPGITVDTHVGRLSRRLGLSVHRDPVKVEHDLMYLVPRKHWTDFSHRLILHGRRICHARKPDCSNCGLRPLCPQVGVAVPKPPAESA